MTKNEMIEKFNEAKLLARNIQPTSQNVDSQVLNALNKCEAITTYICENFVKDHLEVNTDRFLKARDLYNTGRYKKAIEIIKSNISHFKEDIDFLE